MNAPMHARRPSFTARALGFLALAGIVAVLIMFAQPIQTILNHGATREQAPARLLPTITDTQRLQAAQDAPNTDAEANLLKSNASVPLPTFTPAQLAAAKLAAPGTDAEQNMLDSNASTP